MKRRHPLTRLREHILLSLIFIATRAALFAAGVKFDFSLDWMWLSDPADLRERLLETLYYFHAYPPGMNLLTGILLDVGGAHAGTLARAVFCALGLGIVNSLFYLARTSGLSAGAALALAVGFSLIPQTIYFENLFLYEYPIAALLCLAAVFFYHGVRGASLGAWLGFFCVCSAIGLTRTTFHLVWFVVMIALGLWFAGRPARRRVLGAACVPALLLLSLYVKNFAVFGTFGAFTFGPANYAVVTIARLPPEVRASWIAEGRLSPFAAMGVDDGPREFLPFFDTSENSRWPQQLNVLERPSVNAANYNHWFFLEVNRRRESDAFYYVRNRPREYLNTVLEGLGDIFTPSTEWHPLDKAGASPHEQHRQVLRRYEALYTRFVHSFPVAPFGLYAFLPLVVVWTSLRARSLTQARDADSRARGALLFFCLFQIAFVVTASSVFTFRESARYRYQVETMILLTTALSVASLWRWVAGRLAASRSEH